MNQPVQSSSFDQGHTAILELSSFHMPGDRRNNYLATSPCQLIPFMKSASWRISHFTRKEKASKVLLKEGEKRLPRSYQKREKAFMVLLQYHLWEKLPKVFYFHFICCTLCKLRINSMYLFLARPMKQ